MFREFRGCGDGACNTVVVRLLLLLLLRSRWRIDEILGVKTSLILGLRRYLDLEFCLLGRLEVVGQVGGLVKALEGP